MRFAPADLEDEDLLEMVNAGSRPVRGRRRFSGAFWAAVLPELKLHPEVALRAGAQIAWAIRKNSPLLKAELDAFLAKYPAGSTTRNILFQKYLKNTKFVKNAAVRGRAAQASADRRVFPRPTRTSTTWTIC